MQGNSVRNNPVTEQDMIVAEDIFGKDLSHLKGKTTRQTPKAIVNDTIAVPRELHNTKDRVAHRCHLHQRDAISCIDWMPNCVQNVQQHAGNNA